ncbi:MAG: amidohydrolase family protein [Solirubrobacterales bacterium]|nr:amidohydrolase family protein [Solirubrobacterales bacterium]
MVIDVHTHFIPPELIEMIGTGEGPTGLTVERRADRDPLIVHDNGLRYPAFEVFRDVDARLRYMDERSIDVSVISISPSLYLYWLDPGETVEVCRMLNDAAAVMAGDSGGRVRALATVPMNDPAAAADELRRARTELGLVGVEIGTSVGTRQLDAAAFDGFFAVAEELAMPVMLHPYLSMITAPAPGLEGYHLGNVIGNPVETFAAACRLLVGGVFDRHPGLRVILVHGGGALPYQIGRLQHAYSVRDETRATAVGPPLDYIENLLFDTIVFDRRALDFLITIAGSERVLFGTDLPFDMGDISSPGFLDDHDPAIAERILGGNAAELFGIEAPVASAVEDPPVAS